ncbi:MAG: helicase-related protein [Deltaproteobacteria bacterium]
MECQSFLPIDAILPEVKRALIAHDAAVLQAPPGAGKTTRVPPALLGEKWLADQRIVMLEPRRLAATNSARYMAACLGEEVGKRVGYAIRFEQRISSATRIEVVTEGILLRRLQADPSLSGVGLVIFDEFHERRLQSDLALALCRDAQLGLREDLRLLVMSATLDAAPVARLLGDAPLVTSSGRTFPVTIRHLKIPVQGPVAAETAAAVRMALTETAGDILAFLPGAEEIRCCAKLLAGMSKTAGVRILPLFADLPCAKQEQAILPGERRKVVLSTTIAETSLTIEGVRTVVDSGLARRPRFDPAAGISRLETVRISRASSEQRAGRAGRLAPGVCYRLWTEADEAAFLPFTPPEIRAADLAPLALSSPGGE